MCMPRSNKHTISDAEFINAVKSSQSVAEALRIMGLPTHGSFYKFFKIRVEKLELDTAHFTGQAYLKGKTHNWSTSKISLEDILIENSTRVFRDSFKKRILDEGLIESKCSKCGLIDTWQAEPITLQIDHINGNPFDHRLSNLRLLCPNCHSQTPTYGSKNISKKNLKQKIKTHKVCIVCGGICKNRKAKYCESCYALKRKDLQSPYDRKKKIDWPPIQELLDRLAKSNYFRLAKELGVSDNAIRKHIKVSQNEQL